MMDKIPVSSIHSFKPTSLNHLIGQDAVVKTLNTAIRAYFNDRMAGRNPRPENVIAVGPAGVGKTTACQILHMSYGFPEEKFKEVIGTSLGVEDLTSLLISMDEDSTLYIDEAMGLSEACKQVLLKSLEEQVLFVGKQKGGKIRKIPLEKFHCCISLTDEYKLDTPLRQRFPIYCRFQLYDEESLHKIIQQRALSCGIELSEPEVILSMLSSRAKQTPRIALHLLSACWRVARSYDQDCITIEHVKEAMNTAQICPLGCDTVEQSYLKILYEAGKPVRLNVLASYLSLPNQTLAQVTEDWLVRARLIERLPEGRILTEKGKCHVREYLL